MLLSRAGASGALTRRVEELWHGLIEGRYTVIDHFERDGRLHVIGCETAPGATPTTRLTAREREVATHLALGLSMKEAAYEMGIAESTARSHTANAARKLAVPSRLILARLAQMMLRASDDEEREETEISVTELTLEGRHCWCIAAAVLPHSLPPQLSNAEQDVCRMLLSGLANADVARRRGTSVRTVANQCASIYGKLAVCSRGELRAKLARPGGRGESSSSSDQLVASN